jgi:ketosteroid isomerase-like protein
LTVAPPAWRAARYSAFVSGENVENADNVEIVRQALEAGARREADVVFALYDRDVEWDATRMQLGVDDAVYRGHEGLVRFYEAWREAWQDEEYGYDELVDAGGPVLSIATQQSRARAGGGPVTRTLVGVWTVRDAKIVRVVWFLSREEALEAVRRDD